MHNKYRVTKTACYPCAFKVHSDRDNDNSWVNYFRTRKEANIEAEKRNEKNR